MHGRCSLFWKMRLQNIGLTWKPSSLEILRAGERWNGTFLQWDGVGATHKIKLVNYMVILGAKVDQKGSDETTLNFRASQAWLHFHERTHIFCSGHLPLRKRWLRLRDTMFRTMLHGAGGLQMCENNDSTMDALEKTRC